MCGIVLGTYILSPHPPSWSPVNPPNGSWSLSSMCWPRHRQLHARGAWVGNQARRIHDLGIEDNFSYYVQGKHPIGNDSPATACYI